MPTDASVSVSLSARIPNVSQLTDLLGDLKTKVGAVQVPDIPVARIEELAGRFSISVPDTTSWPAAIPRDALAALERLPDAAALVKPLTEPLARVQRILAFPVNDELKRIEEALAALTPASLASPEELVRGLIDPLSHVTAFLQGSELVKLAGAVATLLGATDAERFPRDAAAAVADLQALLRDRVAAAILAVTGLASVSTTVIRTERLVGVIGSTFSLDATNARYQDVLRAYGEGPDGLAAGIAGLDVADASQVAAMHGRLSGARQTFETLQLSLVRDLAFSEASLMVLNTGALQASLEKTAAALGALQTDQIKALAASVQTIAADLTAGFTVDPTLTLDEFRKLLGEGFGHARTTVDRIDLGGIRNLLRSLLDVIQQPFKALQDLKDAVESLTRSAMAELQQALSAIDLGALQRGADQFLDRLGDQLAELERLSSDLRGAIEGVLQEAAAALEALRQALLDPENGLKKQIQGVFESVFALLDGLGIQGAVDEVTGVLQPVTVELGKIEFAPVFDATAD